VLSHIIIIIIINPILLLQCRVCLHDDEGN